MPRTSPEDNRPERRALRIYALDPMLERDGATRATVEIPYRTIEQHDAWFCDDRLEVIDFDAAADRYYAAIRLDDPQIATQQGVEPSESDPQFHQQMVYAVASRVLEAFDRALGRRLRFWGGNRLRLIPHAFHGRNAFYDEQLIGVVFGYFMADDDDPGANLPGQLVFTCLSHDIVAHEVAHAGLDRLHRYFREPTSPQVPALHEAFADVVALLQRFSLTPLVREAIRTTRGDLLGKPNPLVDLGAQFGAAAGRGNALRSVAGPVDPTELARTREPHRLGRILVSAIFEGFVRTYERRTADLIRIATGGSGRLADGELHPDLINRLTAECARTAQTVLSMCIRATDYLPPVDPTFSDYLRAMVTADYELNRADELGLRASMIEAFRIRNIRPEAVGSLAAESILLEPTAEAEADPKLADIVGELLRVGALEMSRNDGAPKPRHRRKDEVAAPASTQEWIAERALELTMSDDDDEPDEVWSGIGRRLYGWVAHNRARLGLEDGKFKITGYHPVHRIAASGELLVEMVLKIVQTRDAHDDLGGLKYRAGVTMIASLDGRIRYLIKKPFDEARAQRIRDWVAEFDAATWPIDGRAPRRLLEAFSSRALDARRLR